MAQTQEIIIYSIKNISGIMLPVDLKTKGNQGRCFMLANNGKESSAMLTEKEFLHHRVQKLIKKKRVQSRIKKRIVTIS